MTPCKALRLPVLGVVVATAMAATHVARGLSANLGLNYAKARVMLDGARFVDTTDSMAVLSLRYSFQRGCASDRRDMFDVTRLLPNPARRTGSSLVPTDRMTDRRSCSRPRPPHRITRP